MKVAKFTRGTTSGQGVVVGDQVQVVGPLAEGAAEWQPFTLPALSSAELSELSHSQLLSLADVQLVPPVDATARLFCVGINYRAHADEADRELPPQPAIFLRTLDSVSGHLQTIQRPKVSEQFDFEGEIAVVIGKGGRSITREDAMSHVFGYTCFMDGSVRDFQKYSITAGKNFHRSGAIGPWIVTADEIENYRLLALSTRLNGEQMQHTTADQMLYDIPKVISFISSWMPLRSGDIIATGTPSGVGLFRTPQLWMRPGDVLEVSIGQVGTLRNQVQDES